LRLTTSTMHYAFCPECHADSRNLPSSPTRRSSDLEAIVASTPTRVRPLANDRPSSVPETVFVTWNESVLVETGRPTCRPTDQITDRKSTRLNSSHVKISYAVFCLKKKNKKNRMAQT